MTQETKNLALEEKVNNKFTPAKTPANSRGCGSVAGVQVSVKSQFAGVAGVNDIFCGSDPRESFRINGRGGAGVNTLPTGERLEASPSGRPAPLDGGREGALGVWGLLRSKFKLRIN